MNELFMSQRKQLEMNMEAYKHFNEDLNDMNVWVDSLQLELVRKQAEPPQANEPNVITRTFWSFFELGFGVVFWDTSYRNLPYLEKF